MDAPADAGQSDAALDVGQSDIRPTQAPALVEFRRFQLNQNRDVDILFLIDDSPSMAPLQAKMALAFPDFINFLKGSPEGLPNLNVGVVSSSLGAGIWGNVPGCVPGTIGNLNGAFQHRAACTQLHAGQKFVSSRPGTTGVLVNNFDGEIADVLACMVQLGQGGCEFEHQFESAQLALQRAQNPSDPDNAGFLRPTAYLAVVMLTNEDDCSVSASSMLLDPSQQILADPRGGLQSYRCNEFGHRCDGVAPPHAAPAAAQTLNNCASAEDGALVKVDGFVGFLRSLKPRATQILAAAIAGPTTPYVIESSPFPIVRTGGVETQPAVVHACMQNATEYADPGVRIKGWVDAFGANGVFQSICANDLRPAMVGVATAIDRMLGGKCVAGAVLGRPDGTPDCAVYERTISATNTAVDTPVPFCDGAKGVVPCWTFLPGAPYCATGQLFRVCYDAACDPTKIPTGQRDALVACAISAPAI